MYFIGLRRCIAHALARIAAQQSSLKSMGSVRSALAVSQGRVAYLNVAWIWLKGLLALRNPELLSMVMLSASADWMAMTIASAIN
jgi:hypothetical protein